MAGKSDKKSRNELNGMFGKRFIVGMEEYHKSTHEERHHVLKEWREKGYQTAVEERGEINESPCPVRGCKIDSAHRHYAVAEDVQGMQHHATTL